jgi:hypothetical protein
MSDHFATHEKHFVSKTFHNVIAFLVSLVVLILVRTGTGVDLISPVCVSCAVNSRDGSYQNAARSSTSPVPDGGGGSGKFSRGPVRRGVSDEGQDAGPDDGKREAGGKKNSTVAVAPILAQPRREDVKAEPAPAPAVNVWAVRLESQKSSSPASAISSSSSAPPLSKTSSEYDHHALQ